MVLRQLLINEIKSKFDKNGNNNDNSHPKGEAI